MIFEFWKKGDGQVKDSHLLAAVSHTMARRADVLPILAENKERYKRVERFLIQYLASIAVNNFDKAFGAKPRASVALCNNGFSRFVSNSIQQAGLVSG